MSEIVESHERKPAQPKSPPPATTTPRPRRSAWIEIDLGRLRRNLRAIFEHKPKGVEVLSVVKDNAYGHGALAVAHAALEAGATCLALSTLEEAVTLRDQGVRAPMLMLGGRTEFELSWCLDYHLTCCVNDRHTVRKLAALAESAGRRVPVHLKVNTGMNRYGVRWTEAPALVAEICAAKALVLEGVLSHFAMSDETDKTFALLQLERFNQVCARLVDQGVKVRYRHLCNSGGFLDLPQAHLDMVRPGILQLGVYPSKVCRRLEGIEPVMTVKAAVADIQFLQKDDIVGYGLRYTAPGPRRVAVIPVGFGDGYPRIRNLGCVLIGGRRAPIVGGVAMDAFMVDTTELPALNLWDEAVLMGRQGAEEISVHEIAQWKNSVSYDVMTSWRARLPRVYVGEETA